MTISTQTHVPDSENLKAQLIAKTHSHDWYVIHQDTQSILYYEMCIRDRLKILLRYSHFSVSAPRSFLFLRVSSGSSR